jgi:hypothetical protein
MRYLKITYPWLVITTMAMIDCQEHWMPEYPPDTTDQITITQGVWGNVWFLEGNFRNNGTITPVVREIYVHTLTPLDAVNPAGDSGFYYEIYTQLITTTVSNNTGFFEVALPPGRYSFFVKEDSLFYAYLYDEEGNILPATVVEDSITEVLITITYKVYY